MADTKPTEAERAVSALHDSANLITKLIASGDTKEEVRGNIDRNVKHIDLMLGKDLVKNSGLDLTAFAPASAAGKAFLVTYPVTKQDKD
jgi:hypothetical protein